MFVLGPADINRDFYFDIARGKVPGHLYMHKFGVNYDIDIGIEDVWDGGGIYGFFPTMRKSLNIVSTSAQDNPAGTGATVVRIFGLNHRWDMQTENITLNGLTPVNLAKKYIRIFRMWVVSGNGTNAGIITCRSLGGTIAAQILTGKGQTLMAIYTVPRRFTAYMTYAYASTGIAKSVDLELFVRPFGGVFLIKNDTELYQNNWERHYHTPFPIAARSDIKFTAEVVNNNMTVAAGFDLVLVRDGY